MSTERPENPKRREAAKRWLAWSIARNEALLGQGPPPGPKPDLWGYWYLPSAIEDRSNGVKLAVTSGKQVGRMLRDWERLAPDAREKDLGDAIADMDGDYRSGRASAMWLDSHLEPRLRQVLEEHPGWADVLAAMARWYWKAGSADNVDRLICEIVDVHGLGALSPIMREVVSDVANGIGRDLGVAHDLIKPESYSQILEHVSDLTKPMCIRIAEEWTGNWHLVRLVEANADRSTLARDLLGVLDGQGISPSRTMVARARAHVASLLLEKDDIDGARTQYLKARIAAESPLDGSGVAAEVCLASALAEHRLGNDAHAAVWVGFAMRPLILLRDLTADPIVRDRLAVNRKVTGELARLAFDVCTLEILHQLLAAIANHGLLNCVDPEPHAGMLRPTTFIPDATTSLNIQRSSFESRWVTLAETLRSVDHGQALLQLQLFPSEQGGHITGVYFESSDHANAFRTKPTSQEETTLTSVSMQTVAFLRKSDWERLSYLLLPDEILSGELTPEHLVISVSGPLSAFPFARLPVGSRTLGDLTVISTVPEVGIWPHLPTIAPTGRRAVVYGVDASVDSETGITGLHDETRALADSWHVVDVATSWESLELALQQPCDLLVLGVHGGAGDDGAHLLRDPGGEWIRSETLADLNLPPTVVASSCWSGAVLGEANPFGLVRPAFIGGARSVIVSLWDVESSSTSRVLQTFYEVLPRARSVASALGQAQRSTPEVHTGAYWGLAAVSR